MSDEINVIVVERGRKGFYLRYTDPVTGERNEKSAKTKSKRDAVKAAGEWQSELRNGIASGSNRFSWAAFRDAYEDHIEMTRRNESPRTIRSALNVIETVMKPDNLNRITTKWIATFQRRMLEKKRSKDTIQQKCAILRAALKWAKSEEMISAVPEFPKFEAKKRKRKSKGRPITLEEFERMLTATRKTLEPQGKRTWETIDDTLPPSERARREAMREKYENRMEAVDKSFQFLLRGLWLSGLRLGEALALTWDEWSEGIVVELRSDHAVLLIGAENEKGGEDRTYPLTPDFEAFLRAVPDDQRQGYVFNPVFYRGEPCRRVDTISKAITKIGKAAGVVVDKRKNKFGSAHDLRRAFGARWASRVMPAVLQEMMRHADIQTTMSYYVDIDARETALMLAKLMPEGELRGEPIETSVPEKTKNA